MNYILVKPDEGLTFHAGIAENKNNMRIWSDIRYKEDVRFVRDRKKPSYLFENHPTIPIL